MVSDTFLPVLTGLVQDPVPNVRLNVAKSCEALLVAFHASPGLATFEQALGTLLAQLEQDRDEDVKFFAKKAASLSSSP